MTNNSSTGGYLLPSSTPPAEDGALDAILQGLVVGVTGMKASLVRPRWQQEPPVMPAIFVDWCAIGVVDEIPDQYGYVVHSGANGGSDNLQRHDGIEVLATFYGPNARGNAKLLEDGLLIPQNREVIENNGIVYKGIGRSMHVPELMNERWVQRVDLPISFRRIVIRTYPILNVESAEITLIGEEGFTNYTETIEISDT